MGGGQRTERSRCQNSSHPRCGPRSHLFGLQTSRSAQSHQAGARGSCPDPRSRRYCAFGFENSRLMETMEWDARIAKIREALPEGGLFHEREWRVSPTAFPLDEKLAEELEKLGHRLLVFLRACNQLYRLSAEGRQPKWVA